VISTANVQHLESLNDSIFELTGIRVRETFPDRILDQADEVVVVDLRRRSCASGCVRARSTRKERAEVALENFFQHDNSAALRELVLREVAEDVEERRRPDALEPFSQQAVAERACSPSSNRSRNRSGS
jgi:two-component system sensor histidine kinase KdpD